MCFMVIISWHQCWGFVSLGFFSMIDMFAPVVLSFASFGCSVCGSAKKSYAVAVPSISIALHVTAGILLIRSWSCFVVICMIVLAGAHLTWCVRMSVCVFACLLLVACLCGLCGFSLVSMAAT